MWPARGRSARRCSRSWPGTASSGSPPTRRSSAARPTARSAATAGATSATPSCSIAPGRSPRAGTSWRIVFRDHALSDQIGFHYQRSPGPAAAADFLGKLHAIGDACRQNPATLVPVILDGENCWEYYPDGGVSFLRSLYQRGRPRPAGPARHGRRVPPRAPAGRHPAPALRRELDQPQLRHLDRPRRGQPRLGRAARDPRVPRPRGRGPGATTRRPSPGPGTRSTSPRGATGSGGTATTTPAPWTRCSTTCSASTCRTSTPCSATTRPAPSSRRSRGPRATGRSTTSRELPQREGRRPLDLLRVDQRRPLPLRQRARDDGPGDARGLAGRLVRLRRRAAPDPRRHRGRPARDRLAEVDRLRIGFVDPADCEIVVRVAVAAPADRQRSTAPGRPSSNGDDRRGGQRPDPRAGRPLRPARPEGRRPDPLLRRAARRATPASTAPPARGSSS